MRVTNYVIRAGGKGLQKWIHVRQLAHRFMFSCFLPPLSPSSHLSCQECAEKATDSAAASQRGRPVSGGDLGWGGGGGGGWDLSLSLPTPHPFLRARGSTRGGHSAALQGPDEGAARGQLLQRWTRLPGRHYGATSPGYQTEAKRRIIFFWLWKLFFF